MKRRNTHRMVPRAEALEVRVCLAKPGPPSPLLNPAIAYLAEVQSKRQVFVATADGSAHRQLTSSDTNKVSPVFSHVLPDGSTRIAFLQRDNPNYSAGNIYSMKPDGSDLRLEHAFDPLDGGPNPTEDLEWSPDGRYFAFSSADGNFHPHVYVLNRETGALTDLTPGGGDMHAWDPSWSPDGTRIAFSGYTPETAPDVAVNGDGLFVITLSTNPDGTLGGTIGPDLTTIPDMQLEPAWDPTSQYLVYNDLGTGAMGRVRADGTQPPESLGVGGVNPTYSPDGQFIAFGNNAEIGRINADGTGQVNLTNTRRRAEHRPDWNPQWVGAASAPRATSVRADATEVRIIDATAAGHGWFVDATPGWSEEHRRLPGSHRTRRGTAADGRRQ